MTLQLKDYTKVPSHWTTLFSHVLTVFIVASFVLGFPGKGHTYNEYRSEIRLTRAATAEIDRVGVFLLPDFCFISSRRCSGLSPDPRLAC